MALATGKGFQTQDVDTDILHVDLSSVIASLIFEKTDLLGVVTSIKKVKGKNGVLIPAIADSVDTPEYGWWEEYPGSITVTGDISDPNLAGEANTDWDTNTAQTTLYVTSNDVNMQVGTLLMDTATGKSEIIQVTAIEDQATDGVTNGKLTVTRGYGNTTAEVHANDAVWQVVSMPAPEGTDPRIEDFTLPTKKTNYTQIFERSLRISNTVLNSARKIESKRELLKREARKKLLSLRQELSRTIIYGTKSASIGSASTHRTMGGIKEFINVSGGNVDSTSEALTYSVLCDLAESVLSDGGFDAESQPFVVTSSKQARAISGFDSTQVQWKPSDMFRGTYANHVLTDTGIELPVMVSRWIKDDELYILDRSKIKFVKLAGRDMKMTQLSKTGDYETYQIIGEYGLKVKLGKYAMALHTNLT